MSETREEHRQRLEHETGVPMTYCRQCDTGPFCLTKGPWADLCADCRQPLDREANGWTPENSID
jgi:hypothetical protein